MTLTYAPRKILRWYSERLITRGECDEMLEELFREKYRSELEQIILFSCNLAQSMLLEKYVLPFNEIYSN